MSDIYNDIATRTGGNIYIGVVGPVRTGKSTFIKEFMEQAVIPNIESDYSRERAVDELPQSAGGRTIMTTEPKFIPEDAVSINVGESTNMNVRLIDCVGYIIPSAIGYIENEAPRMVKTPWFDDEVPFNMAAEVGTRKVITEHSTVGLVITTDGTVTDLPREEYEECEERIISELKAIDKPFAIILNSTDPESDEVLALADRLTEKYGRRVIPLSCARLSDDDIKKIMTELLYSFPVTEINIEMPTWINALDDGHWLRREIFGHIRSCAIGISSLRDMESFAGKLADCEQITESTLKSVSLSDGTATVTATMADSLFFRIIGECTGLECDTESDLMPQILSLVSFKKRFEKFSSALDDVEQKGYGIVMPSIDELDLDEPEIIKQGGKYGVRLRASAPAIHIMKTKVNAEVAPIVGSQKQSQELVMAMMSDYETEPDKLWQSNIFGKSLHELVNEGLITKMNTLPDDARRKLRETVERMINEGCSGLICFIL
ncbi:MAG: stage IV sporulation protein A [Ruminococcus sp.]|nr:stage IV sporulation protein A [Ruminococcus sp.]